MMKKIKTLAILTATSLLVACGGGGGGDSGPVTSTDVFQLGLAWKNRQDSSETRNFTMTGTVSGIPVSASGTETRGSLVATTFESKPARSKTTVGNGTISGGGNTAPFGGSEATYIDANYNYLGSFDGDTYCVVVGTSQIPVTAKVNDTGTLYTENCYTSSTKATPTGTNVVTYALQPDTATTAILKLILSEFTTGGALDATTIATFRITTNGGVQPLTQQYQDGTSTFTLSY